jgi:hypothetical protein
MRMGYWWESPEEKRQLGRTRHRWVDDIKMDLREVGQSAGLLRRVISSSQVLEHKEICTFQY